ncbi:hypothetical protein AALP_AA3G298900 [Arabis alpina]|uniref:Uncharacterized protein n=1 Tax=Arabis alpina TaxID=50452 RepID=A0A087HCL4_ARAAL|nr:hypothetical protein AALP_AA3G298900 [Arabis alpina]
MIHSCSEERKIMIIWSLCLIFALSNSILLVTASPSKHLCLPDQRDALWEFKNEFYVDSSHSDEWFLDKTEKWRYNTDCCSWDGVSCDPKTGKIVELDLEDSALNGPLRSNSSLFRLQYLQKLSLSSNNFSGILPDSIGNLKYLSHLWCSNCNLHGEIPSSLGNLSYLAVLNLSYNHFTSEGPNLQLVLPKLRSLISIDLGYNQFKGIPLKISSTLHFSSPMIDTLTLSSCNISEFPKFLENQTELWYLDISANQIEGQLPEGFGRLPGLWYVNIEDTCGGGGEEEATKEEQDEEKEEKEQVLSWIAAAIAYAPGVVCGLTIAYIRTS